MTSVIFRVYCNENSNTVANKKPVYITNPVKTFNIQAEETPQKKSQPLDMEFFIDPTGEIPMESLDLAKFTPVQKKFNPGFYNGVLWIKAQFHDSGEKKGINYNLTFGLYRFVMAEAFGYNTNDGRYLFLGRTGVGIDSKYISAPTLIPSILINERDFPEEEVHTILIRLISYSGNSITIDLMPSKYFSSNERLMNTANTTFVGFAFAILFFIIFFGILSKEKIFHILGGAAALLFVCSYLSKTPSQTNILSPQYALNILNIFISTMVFTYIIKSCTGKKRYIEFFISNLILIAVLLTFLFTGSNSKINYIVINLGTILACINLIVMWALHLHSGRQDSYIILDAWVLALMTYIVLRILNFIENMFETAIIKWEIAYFVPQNLIFISMTTSALIILFQRYRKRITQIKTENQRHEEIQNLFNENLEIRRLVDQKILNSSNTMKNILSQPQTRNSTEVDNLLLASLTRIIDLLTVETALENNLPGESKPVDLKSAFEKCLHNEQRNVEKKNLDIQIKTSGIENVAASINPDTLDFLIGCLISTSIRYSVEGSKFYVSMSLAGNRLALSTRFVTDSSLHKSTKDFINNKSPSTVGLYLINRILPFYEGNFKAEDTGSGYAFTIQIKIDEENSLVQSKTEEIQLKKKNNVPTEDKSQKVDDLFLIDGQIPSVLAAVELDTSRDLLEEFLSPHCNLCTTDSGYSAWKKIKTATNLGSKLPDIIISDTSLPVMSGLDFYKKCQTDDKIRDIPFVFVASASEKNKINEYLSMGAIDCLERPFTSDRLYRCIISVFTMSQKIKRSLISQVTKTLLGENIIQPKAIPLEDSIKETPNPLPLSDSQSAVLNSRGLSSREQQIVTLILQGQTDKEIAQTLNISSGTVATHNKRIFKKMEVHSRIELVNKVR